MTELRVVRARGDGMARGLQIGGELSDLIQRSVEFYHRYLDRRSVSSATLQDLLAALPFLALALFNRRMDVIAVAAALILVTAFVLPGMLILMLAWISPQLIHKRKRPGHSARAVFLYGLHRTLAPAHRR